MDEIGNGLASVIEFDPAQDHELQVNCSDCSKKQFKFDHVFKPEDNQGNPKVQIQFLSELIHCFFMLGEIA